MSVEQNMASMYRCFEEVWNKGNLAAIPEVISPDYVAYGTQGEIAGKGLDYFEQGVKTVLAGMPDLRYTIDSVVAQDDTLAIRLTLTGTFTGKMGDTEPTGRQLDSKMALFNRYVDGKCVEARPFADTLARYRQMGIPVPAQ